MLEWLIPSVLLLGAAMIPKGKKSDEKKIEEVFENRNFGVKKGDKIKYPKLVEKHESETHTTYLYSLPLGIPSLTIELLLDALKEALNKEVDYEFDGLLKLRVYHNPLPNKWEYTDDLLRLNTWEIPIGQNHQGIVYHDFDKYPHFLVGGVTRFGKTVFLKEVIYSILKSQFHNVEIFILDLKGGMEFSHYLEFPQIKAVASNIHEAAQVLGYLKNDLKNQQAMFRSNRYVNIVHSPIKKRKFIIVDEGAELSPQIVDEKDVARFCQSVLSEIARIGGALGYRLIFCTQYPTKEAVPMQVKMNIVARLSFVAAARVASQVILDDVGAENLPSIPGRAIYLIEKQRVIQVPYIDDEYIFKHLNEEVIL